jgi:hypothetical protein
LKCTSQCPPIAPKAKILYIRLKIVAMENVVVIDSKSYVIVPQESYHALQKKAALKTKPEKLLTIEEARAHSKKLIRKWAAGK